MSVKITKSQLKQIIQEEIQNVLQEYELQSVDPGFDPRIPSVDRRAKRRSAAPMVGTVLKADDGEVPHEVAPASVTDIPWEEIQPSGHTLGREVSGKAVHSLSTDGRYRRYNFERPGSEDARDRRMNKPWEDLRVHPSSERGGKQGPETSALSQLVTKEHLAKIVEEALQKLSKK
jgi:hypothetical protein